MMRKQAILHVGPFDERFVAGEESELCIRLRRGGWKIWRLDHEMAIHDAAIKTLQQWNRRMLRSGYAFALGSFHYGHSEERHWLWESRRAVIWGIWIPLAAVAVSCAYYPWSLLIWLIYPLQMLRQVVRSTGSFKDRATVAIFQNLGRFPESWGYLKFQLDRIRSRRPRIIEHK